MLEARGVGKAYGSTRALKAVDLTIPTRSLVTVVGPSGCGKTTLLRILAGLEAPDEGRIVFEGNDITRSPAHVRGFGFVFQDFALFPHLNVERNVAFGLRSKGVDRASALGRAREALERVNLRGFGARRVETLSGGEAQRVALARALAPEPSVLLLDEPLASLDRELREDLRREIRRVHRELGLTTAYVTHDRDEALTLGDRVVILQAGSIVESGRPEELLSNPKTAFGARFLGAWNALPAERDGAYVRSVLGLGQPVTAAAKGAKGPGHLLIAKEAIVIESAEAGAAAGLPCRLVEFAPHLRMATVEVGGVLVTGRADFSGRRAAGELVRISVDPKEGRFVSTDGVGEGK